MIRRLLCRWFGHRWVWRGEIEYDYGTTMAYVGGSTEKTEVGVAWVHDEDCSRCGAESWWPT